MRTALCRMLGLKTPIVLAPMGGAVGPRLAAAVSNAGGLGAIPLWGAGVESLRRGVGDVRALTDLPFMVNINLAFPHDDLIDACLDLDVSLISLFWGVSPPAIAKARSGGARVMVTVASSAQAREAVQAGADFLVAQGWEAGGHVRSDVATMALVPAIVDAAGEVPVIAAGGIADGRGLAAALALGAQGAWIGTRFLASAEAEIHPEYQRRILSAGEEATFHSADLYNVGWPDAPHRTLKNSTWLAWNEAGRPDAGGRPNESQVIGASGGGGDLPRYGCVTPRAGDTGEIEAMSMWSGQGVGLVREVMPAAAIVDEISRDAERALLRLGAIGRGAD